jgi:subtilisin family serine protease
VAGVVALIRAANPKLSPKQIRSLLNETATNPYNDAPHYGAGLIDAEKAVTKAHQLR